MTWIKLDDKAHRHPKIEMLSDRAFRWWVRALSYASEFLTNGELPAVFLRTVPRKVQAEMHQVGLWDTDAGGRVSIHDYLTHQTSRESVERERERNRVRRRGGTGGTPGGTAGGSTAEKPRADTENREQRTDPEGRTSSSPRPPASLIVSPLAFDRKHGGHLVGFCDWVCFPSDLAEQFAARAGWDLDQVRGWAEGVRSVWRGAGKVASGSMYDFWNARWKEAHPPEQTKAPDWRDEIRAREAAKR